MALWWIPLIAVAGIHVLLKWNKDSIDRFAMGIVRDIGRYKAMKRRNMNSKGLINTLMKQDDLNEELKIILSQDEKDGNDLPTYTDNELLEFGSGIDGKPILIGLLGHVYDVSAGSKFYGEGQDYGGFAGHDVTYSLATGCKTEECIATKSENFTENQLNEAKRWLSFFFMHDKYNLVGKMESNYVDLMIDDMVEKGTSSITNVEDESEDAGSNHKLNGDELDGETTSKEQTDNDYIEVNTEL
jgi:predicted heme/steroid binding protein